jgi:arginyl-tRNA--protein-N-Asp/Glu arginylyltransferase
MTDLIDPKSFQINHLQAHDLNHLNALSNWQNEQFKLEWQNQKFNQYMSCPRVSPQTLDQLLADGWRHFGCYFFRDMFNMYENAVTRVLPLRIVLDRFKLAKDQKRNLKKNQDLIIEYGPLQITQAHINLFEKHAVRFEHPPESLYTYFEKKDSHLVPSLIWSCCVYLQQTDEKELIAASYFDFAQESLSSIFAIFDPKYEARGLGTFTLLMEILFAQQQQKKYVYTGYAYRVSSHYDYKKRYEGTEFYDYIGNWYPLEQLDQVKLRKHRYER